MIPCTDSHGETVSRESVLRERDNIVFVEALSGDR